MRGMTGAGATGASGSRVRPERPDDVAAVDAVVAAAFGEAAHSAPPRTPGGPPGEVDLLQALRRDEGWIPDLALVAEVDDTVVGQVVCTRAHLDDVPVLGLGPVAVRPERQGAGIGAALVRDVLDRAGAAGETLVALLGDPAYYGRFGFRPARELGVVPPDPAYGDYFQARTLGDAPAPVSGTFRYAAPFAGF